jgi:hypothetical protein
MIDLHAISKRELRRMLVRSDQMRHEVEKTMKVNSNIQAHCADNRDIEKYFWSQDVIIEPQTVLMEDSIDKNIHSLKYTH